ncbi:MAG: methionine--tRNA ligase subunit beta [Bdellovibrionales bacterium]|nr:methionine--tRNA ligase subunit beta [Bdellovibrionales bacterium]
MSNDLPKQAETRSAAETLSPSVDSSEIVNAGTPAIQAAAQQADEQIDIELFGRVKLRVGQIESAEKIEKSKKLLKLQVNLGPTYGKRQILAGISQFYQPEELVGRKIVVVANLKPAKLMGEESQGMLLAASNQDLSVLNLVDPGQDLEVGSEVR